MFCSRSSRLSVKTNGVVAPPIGTVVRASAEGANGADAGHGAPAPFQLNVEGVGGKGFVRVWRGPRADRAFADGRSARGGVGERRPRAARRRDGDVRERELRVFVENRRNPTGVGVNRRMARKLDDHVCLGRLHFEIQPVERATRGILLRADRLTRPAAFRLRDEQVPFELFVQQRAGRLDRRDLRGFRAFASRQPLKTVRTDFFRFAAFDVDAFRAFFLACLQPVRRRRRDRRAFGQRDVNVLDRGRAKAGLAVGGLRNVQSDFIARRRARLRRLRLDVQRRTEAQQVAAFEFGERRRGAGEHLARFLPGVEGHVGLHSFWGGFAVAGVCHECPAVKDSFVAVFPDDLFFDVAIESRDRSDERRQSGQIGYGDTRYVLAITSHDARVHEERQVIRRKRELGSVTLLGYDVIDTNNVRWIRTVRKYAIHYHWQNRTDTTRLRAAAHVCFHFHKRRGALLGHRRVP